MISWQDATLRWYGILLLASVAAAPWVRILCASLADRGASVVRPVALLVLIYPAWLVASVDLLPYSTTTLWTTLLVLAVGGWSFAFHRRIADRAWLMALALSEIVSITSFGLFVWLRGFTPDLTFTEKPMDSALLHASTLATAMPPLDPWLAGQQINYYYLGYVVHGSLARLASVPAAIGFNLALATTFSMATTVSAGLTFNILRLRQASSVRRAVVGGVLASFFVVVAGNLYGARRFIIDSSATWQAGWWDSQGIGWRSSRIVCDAPRVDGECVDGLAQTINEFPFFSFLLGDLHPHLMALPFVLMSLVLALNLYLIPSFTVGRYSTSLWLRVAASGALLGALYPLNSWDYPTFMVCCLAALWWGHPLVTTRRRVILCTVLAAASVIAWLPFNLQFVPLTAGDRVMLPEVLRDVPLISRFLTTVGAVTGPRTSVSEYLTIFGIFWLSSIALCGFLLWRVERPLISSATLRYVAIPFSILALTTLLLPAPVIALSGTPLVVALVLLGRDRSPTPQTAALALFAGGHGLILITEFLYIQDRFGTRMNTVFKAYYQVWVLFSIATALTLAVFWRESRGKQRFTAALGMLVTIFVVAGSVYPIVASLHWTNDLSDWRGLDGTAYLERSFPDELAAITWLQANASVDDVVLESAGCSYENVQGMPVNRISTYTGIPTVVGWGFHEAQWRSGQPELNAEIGPRQEAVRGIYEGNVELVKKFGVTHIVVGLIEQNGVGTCQVAGPYTNAASESFSVPEDWELAFAQGDVRIYRMLDRA